MGEVRTENGQMEEDRKSRCRKLEGQDTPGGKKSERQAVELSRGERPEGTGIPGTYF